MRAHLVESRRAEPETGCNWLRATYLMQPEGWEHDASTQWFSPDHWRCQGRILRTAVGRGDAIFVGGSAAKSNVWVLRHYRRGGLLSGFNRDFYLWTGLRGNRAYRELKLLSRMQRLGLPTPTPVAAKATRSFGLFVRNDLLTVAIPGAVPLAERVSNGPLGHGVWREIGRAIALMHRHGVWHADLNARNILIDDKKQPWLIDFDRGRLKKMPGSRWRYANLRRLKRSLEKFATNDVSFYFKAGDWAALESRYDAVFSAEDHL